MPITFSWHLMHHLCATRVDNEQTENVEILGSILTILYFTTSHISGQIQWSLESPSLQCSPDPRITRSHMCIPPVHSLGISEWSSHWQLCPCLTYIHCRLRISVILTTDGRKVLKILLRTHTRFLLLCFCWRQEKWLHTEGSKTRIQQWNDGW